MNSIKNKSKNTNIEIDNLLELIKKIENHCNSTSNITINKMIDLDSYCIGYKDSCNDILQLIREKKWIEHQ